MQLLYIYYSSCVVGLHVYMYERLQNTHRIERSILNVSLTDVYNIQPDFHIYFASSERYTLSFEI